jgi:anti-sigma-K factor RskA
VFEVARQPGSVTAIMTGDEGTGPTGVAAISAAGDMSLAMRDLAPTSGNQVYETWVIGADGAPVPVGSFQVGNAGTASFTTGGLPSQDGIVVALTLEPAPGATTPTLPLVSSGTATVTG